MSKKNRKKNLFGLFLLAFIGLLLSENPLEGWKGRQTGFFIGKDSFFFEQEESTAPSENLTVHYLDVEKCNCALVCSSDGHFMLIDAGSNDDAHTEETMEYLKAQGVERLDYLVVTHPHMDHIRSVPEIVNRFEVTEVLMGDFSPDMVGTKIYCMVLDAIQEKGILRTSPAEGEVYQLGNASFSILANDDSAQTAAEDLNNTSIVLRLTDGLHDFLFCGDAEKELEAALLEKNADLSADVLLAAHHGSSSSNSPAFLEAVGPQIVVISCGADMDGEAQKPAQSVLKAFENLGTKVFRSDENGDVVIESLQEGLRIRTEK